MELPPFLYHRIVRPKCFTKLFINNIINQSFKFTNKRVLDFGSGTGCNCSMFEPNNYFGIDPDPFRVKFSKRLHPDYNFTVLEEGNLPFSDNYFNHILVIAVLHHISNKDVLFYQNEFHRILRPDGSILVIEPCYCKMSLLNNGLMKFFDNGQHIRFEEDYLELFDDKNFETNVIKRFKKVFYNEIFFSVKPKIN